MPSRPRRSLVPTAMLPVVIVLAAALVAGCGQRASETRPETRPEQDQTSATPAPDLTWVVRLDTYSGADGETRQAHYVSYRPGSGSVKVIRLPRVKVPQMSGDERVLLVDAGRTWVLDDSRPAQADRDRGLVRLFALGGGPGVGAERTVDVRRASGDPRLRADWAAFDANKPGLLRVVSGLRVWTIQIDAATPKAHREGVLPRRPGWIYGGGFDKNAGTPYIEDIDSFRTLPPGNGDLDQRPIRRLGGRLLITDNGSYRGLPDPDCDLSSGFADAEGAATIFCFDRHTITEKTLAPGASTWKSGPSATSPEIPGQGDPMFTFPPSQK